MGFKTLILSNLSPHHIKAERPSKGVFQLNPKVTFLDFSTGIFARDMPHGGHPGPKLQYSWSFSRNGGEKAF
jgi:hypothetical protein